ncbi:MAG: plastocyanin/azurin family copper-binding protein [Acidimicrobiia bacterium]
MSLGKPARLALVTALAGLIVASCGGGDNGEDAGGSPATSITILATEFAFNPSSVTVAARQDVTITLDNLGAIEHEWTILKAGTTINSEAEFDESQVLFKVPSVAAGQSASGSFNVAAGSYQIICIIQGHFDAGMKGTLSARSG